jgi:YD repeat-containing protein
MAYADPDAPTQIANGISTTTFMYDNNGNVTQKTVDATTTTYVYDYANHLTALVQTTGTSSVLGDVWMPLDQNERSVQQKSESREGTKEAFTLKK